MPAAPPEYWTVEHLHPLPDDGQRYEIIDGELHVSPAPSFRHQRAILELVQRLLPYCTEVGLFLLFAPAAVTWSMHTEVQPDLLVTPLANGRHPERFEDVGRLELAVEVLSPSTRRWDRFTKRREYQRRGVPEYWIVDLEGRYLERWRPGAEEPEVVRAVMAWQPIEGIAPLSVDVEALVAAVLDR